MGSTMRPDFTAYAASLPMPAQRKNLQLIHDDLVGGRGLPSVERVLAVMNFQLGKFLGRPTHVLVLTTARLTYTHDGGVRSIPVESLDPAGLSRNYGAVDRDLVVQLRTGELLRFRKSPPALVNEMAQALRKLFMTADAHAPAPAEVTPTERATASTTGPVVDVGITPPVPRAAAPAGQRSRTPVVLAKPSSGSIYQLAVKAATTDDPFNVEHGDDSSRWVSTIHDPDRIYVVAPPAVFSAAPDWPWEITPGIEGTGTWESVVPFTQGFNVAAGFIGVAGALLGPGLWRGIDSGHSGLWIRDGTIWSETPTSRRPPRAHFAH